MTGCEPFDKWCETNSAKSLPALPAHVARFVQDNAAHGIEWLWDKITAISRAHYMIGLADPTQGGPVSVALNLIAKVTPPRSWPAEHKLLFERLPYDLQVYVAAHEAERETVVRRALNEAATARKALKIQPEKSNGDTKNAAA